MEMDAHTTEEENRRCLKFSYVEASTKEWLEHSLMERLRSMVDLRRVQREAKESGMMLTLASAGKLYCIIINYLDAKSKDMALGDNTKWFDNG